MIKKKGTRLIVLIPASLPLGCFILLNSYWTMELPQKMDICEFTAPQGKQGSQKIGIAATVEVGRSF
jgi:hypothetical protein